MQRKIRVAILDDHQSIVDGYCYRLKRFPQIEIVATLAYGEELEPALAAHPADVLLIDVNVPTSPDNFNPYPILHLIPRLLQRYPDLNVLAISMLDERGLIRAVMEAGASGYLLKDDRVNIENLGQVVQRVAEGGVQLSEKAEQRLKKRHGDDAENLSQRQLEVLSLSLAYPDDSTAELAQRMSVANSTARNLLSGAYLKLGVRTRTAAIAKARRLGLITSEPPASPV